MILNKPVAAYAWKVGLVLEEVASPKFQLLMGVGYKLFKLTAVPIQETGFTVKSASGNVIVRRRLKEALQPNDDVTVSVTL